MTMKISEQKKNPLMKREEIWVSFEHPGKATPPRKEILAEMAKTLKADQELIIIDKIFSEKGRSKSKAKVLVYKKKEDVPKDKIEKMQRRMGKKKSPQEQEKPAEAAAKKEEDTEKKKEEVKPEDRAETSQEEEVKKE